MKWTQRVVRNPAAATATPKRWFDRNATAAKALGATASPEAMVKLLSEDNLELLRLIATRRPAWVSELAMLAGRAISNPSRTLKKLHQAGIVDFEQGPGQNARAARDGPAREPRSRSRRREQRGSGRAARGSVGREPGPPLRGVVTRLIALRRPSPSASGRAISSIGAARSDKDKRVVHDMDFDKLREVRNFWRFFRRGPETYRALTELGRGACAFCRQDLTAECKGSRRAGAQVWRPESGSSEQLQVAPRAPR